MAAAMAGRPLNRDCSCQFLAPLDCKFEEVRAAVVEQVGVANVRGFQAYGKGRYQIFLKDREVATQVSQVGLKLMNEVVPVDQISGGTIVLWVKLAPFEMENDTIAAALSTFGRVKKIEYVYSDIEPRSWLTGERRVMFQPQGVIPNFVKIGIYNVMVTYRGQTRTCRNCDAVGHLAATCPNPRTCSLCKKVGHLKEDCWSREALETVDKSVVVDRVPEMVTKNRVNVDAEKEEENADDEESDDDSMSDEYSSADMEDQEVIRKVVNMLDKEVVTQGKPRSKAADVETEIVDGSRHRRQAPVSEQGASVVNKVKQSSGGGGSKAQDRPVVSSGGPIDGRKPSQGQAVPKGKEVNKATTIVQGSRENRSVPARDQGASKVQTRPVDSPGRPVDGRRLSQGSVEPKGKEVNAETKTLNDSRRVPEQRASNVGKDTQTSGGEGHKVPVRPVDRAGGVKGERRPDICHSGMSESTDSRSSMDRPAKGFALTVDDFPPIGGGVRAKEQVKNVNSSVLNKRKSKNSPVRLEKKIHANSDTDVEM